MFGGKHFEASHVSCSLRIAKYVSSASSALTERSKDWLRKFLLDHKNVRIQQVLQDIGSTGGLVQKQGRRFNLKSCFCGISDTLQGISFHVLRHIFRCYGCVFGFLPGFETYRTGSAHLCMEGSMILFLQEMQCAKTQPNMPDEKTVAKFLKNLKSRDEEAIVCTSSSTHREIRICFLVHVTGGCIGA